MWCRMENVPIFHYTLFHRYLDENSIDTTMLRTRVYTMSVPILFPPLFLSNLILKAPIHLKNSSLETVDHSE